LGMSLYDKFKALDVYRKLPSDFVQPTYSGAMLSIISSIIMVFLFVSELRAYTEIKLGSEMYIDVNRGGDKLNININLDMVRLPCSLLSLDVQDAMGSHMLNIRGHLKKMPIDKDGKQIGTQYYQDFEKPSADNHGHGGGEESQPDYETVKGELLNQQGCRLSGYVEVNKVPGNFHISSHAYGPTIQQLAGQRLFDKYDLSHRIKHISFGPIGDIEEIKSTFNTGELSPLDGTEKMTPEKKVYEYYTKIVPTTYLDMKGKEYYVNQFTSNSNEVVAQMSLPTIFFRFEFSPVTVKYWQYKENFLHFLIQICAIIGGIFSVTGIIDALVHKSVVAIMRKANMGKLG